MQLVSILERINRKHGGETVVEELIEIISQHLRPNIRLRISKDCLEQYMDKVLLLRHIVTKFQNVKGEEMVLKVVVEKCQFIDK